jgi:formamidopyrimidine-DNA glycosylase
MMKAKTSSFMAELPDLTVFANILNRKFSGKTVDRLDITVDKKLNVSADALRSAIKGKELSKVVRIGKTLQFKFSDHLVLGLHLMLRGELVEIQANEIPRFQILAFHFDDGTGFAVIDLQKQATATLNPEQALAPDALELDKEEFKRVLAKKRTVIKTLLMDQKIIRGYR